MKVLFIAGYGRSGSTLLEQLLAKGPEFVALGEVRHLWQRGYLLNTLCPCGAPFLECDFWQTIDKAAFGGLERDEAKRMFDIRRQALRPSRMGRALAHTRLGRAAPDIAHYAAMTSKIYAAAVRPRSGPSVIVDGSKDPLHGLALAGRSDVELHVLHLVRDPRGVARSMQRDKVRPEVYWKEQRETVRPAWRSTAAWLYRNAAVSLLRPLAASYNTLRYEDLVATPNEVLAAVRRQVGLESHPLTVRDGRVQLPATHSVSGNANRFDGRDVRLRLDEGWRAELPRRDRVTVTALAYPLLVRYGYV